MILFIFIFLNLSSVLPNQYQNINILKVTIFRKIPTRNKCIFHKKLWKIICMMLSLFWSILRHAQSKFMAPSLGTAGLHGIHAYIILLWSIRIEIKNKKRHSWIIHLRTVKIIMNYFVQRTLDFVCIRFRTSSRYNMIIIMSL